MGCEDVISWRVGLEDMLRSVGLISSTGLGDCELLGVGWIGFRLGLGGYI